MPGIVLGADEYRFRGESRIGTSQPAKVAGWKNLEGQKCERCISKASQQILPDPRAWASSSLCPLSLALPLRKDGQKAKGREMKMKAHLWTDADLSSLLHKAPRWVASFHEERSA